MKNQFRRVFELAEEAAKDAPEPYKREAFLAVAIANLLVQEDMPTERAERPHAAAKMAPTARNKPSEQELTEVIETGRLLAKILAVMVLKEDEMEGLTPAEATTILKDEFAQRGVHQSNVSRDMGKAVPRLMARIRRDAGRGFAYKINDRGRASLREAIAKLGGNH